MAFAYDLQCNRIGNDHEIYIYIKEKLNVLFDFYYNFFPRLHVSVYNIVNKF